MSDFIARDFKQAYIQMKERAIDARDALDLALDVLKAVQRTYDCPESPIINEAIRQGNEALAHLPQRS